MSQMTIMATTENAEKMLGKNFLKTGMEICIDKEKTCKPSLEMQVSVLLL
jgi:hypothetical protein